MLREYNEFSYLVFKKIARSDRYPKQQDIAHAMKLGKHLGLQQLMSKAQSLTGNHLKDNNNQATFKEKLVQFLCGFIMSENPLDL
jgi:hypothetical protein